MTQDALAEALNITRAGISNYETGRRLPDAETLIKLSKILEYSFEDEAAKAPETGPQAVQETAEAAERPALQAADRAEKGSAQLSFARLCWR